MNCGYRLTQIAILVPAALIALLAAAWPARSQPCSSDSQCPDFGRTRTYCSGNTLVTRQSICAGSCRTVEVSRVPCPGPCVADRCVGGPLTNAPGQPPLGGGRPAGICARLCQCDGKKLTYGLGFARREADCRRRSVDCAYGCSCDPEARCLRKGETSE